MKIFVIIGAFIILLGGSIVWYVAASNSSNEDYSLNSSSIEEEASNESMVVIEEDGTFDGSVNALASSGGSYKCVLDTETFGVKTDGVVQVANGNIRGDFETVAPVVGMVQVHMISDAEHVYTWNSMMSEGIKSERTEEDMSSADFEAEGEAQFDFSGSYSYKCEAASVDPQIFMIPTDISFVMEAQ